MARKYFFQATVDGIPQPHGLIVACRSEHLFTANADSAHCSNASSVASQAATQISSGGVPELYRSIIARRRQELATRTDLDHAD
jgi:hypothetical protein